MIAVDAYLREIAGNVSASLLGEKSGIKIKIKVQADSLQIDPDRASPLACWSMSWRRMLSNMPFRMEREVLF